jgi:4-hydroxybenzoate polyprenyltransferase
MSMPLDQSAIGRSTLRHESFATRLVAYLKERFPVLAYGLLIFCFYSSNQFLAHALTAPGESMRYSWSSLQGAVTLACFFLHLRIFDDHKDYAADCRFFPNRVLQRGVVKLGELKLVAAAAIVAELTLAAANGLAAFVAVLAAVAFSALMIKEFFAAEFLKRHFLLYASVHMLVTPLLALVVFSFATGQFFWQAPPWYWLYSLVGFFVAFNWEISRKIRAPSDERDGVDSYTKLFGVFGAAYMVLLVRSIDTALVYLIAWRLDLSMAFYALIAAAFVVSFNGFLKYRLDPTPKNARRMSTYAGLYIVGFDLALAIELGRTYGLAWGAAP